MPRSLTQVATAVACLTLLAGCASFSTDGGFAPVQRATQDRLGLDAAWHRDTAAPDPMRQRVATLLAAPLTADSAAQVALLTNPGLQARLQALGIAEADVVQAGRLPNPHLTFARLTTGDEREYDRGLSLPLTALITLPWRREIEARRFEATQRGVTQDVLALALDVRSAWTAAVAAEQSARYQRDVLSLADAGASLGRQMAAQGNWSALAQAREQAFAAEAALNVARAEQQQRATRERLTRLLGLNDPAVLKLPERLPDLPAQPPQRRDIEREALAQRLDVQAAALQVEATARSLGLTRRTRFVNVLEVGWQSNSTSSATSGQPTQKGYEIGLELPLFDWSGARVARAEALYLQAANRAAQVAIDARSEAREAQANVQATHDIALRWQRDVVPGAQRIRDESLRRYNGMLIGVFELLADARAQVAAVNGAINAQRDYWLAQAQLDMALIGPVSSTPLMGSNAAPVASTPTAH